MTDFATEPGRYVHWKLEIDGAVARLLMNVDPDKPHVPGYKLKLNSYDLGVDIELADAVQRLRFEHPEVKTVVVTSANPRIFCAGANINMLAQSSHPFKVNFCKFTNETRCAIEDASANSGQHYIAALNGTSSGGGYELASACEEIYLIDDGNSAVSLPEVPLLGVLPGTGGLTRLVDKRKIRRDHADVFSTLAEGLKARRAKEWGFIDGAYPRSRFDEAIAKRAKELAGAASPKDGARGISLDAVTPKVTEIDPTTTLFEYRHVTLRCERERRLAELTVFAPDAAQPETVSAIHEAGAAYWPLRAFRELDDAICRLRFDEEEIGLVLLRTRPGAARGAVTRGGTGSTAREAGAPGGTGDRVAGDDTSPGLTGSASSRDAHAASGAGVAARESGPPIGAGGAAMSAGLPRRAGETLTGARSAAPAIEALLAIDATLAASRGDWLVNEIVLNMARVLRRLDLTAKSLFAIVDAGSCFAGSLLEIALAADRVFMRNDSANQAAIAVGALSAGQLPMPNGLSRLASRFLSHPGRAEKLVSERSRLETPAAVEAGLVTFAPDELDWDDQIRLAVEERLSLSPDALTGMEASLRFGGPETMDSKIYGRLSAWQNWIFIRPNATGERGALRLYGQPDRPKFDWRRT